MNYYEYENYLAHYGVKGMKWGVRRYQKKDGTLTSAGKKRLVKDLKKEYNREYSSGFPYRTSDSYKQKLRSEIDKFITDDDKKRITAAKDKWYASMDAVNKAERELYKIAEKQGREYYNAELKRNPQAYDEPRAKNKLLDYAVGDYGYDKAREMRPDLDKISRSSDKYWNAYKNECKKVSDKILGEYGDTKLHKTKYTSLTIKDTVGDVVMSMETNKWK